MKAGQTMKNIKFVVRVNRCGARVAEFVQLIDRTPIQTTTNRMLALLMGRFTAEDAIKSIQNSRCSFFFQAEDGIRDIGVTGVQTCALPISTSTGSTSRPRAR